MKNHWVEVELGEIAEIKTGTTPSKKNSEFYRANELNFYKPSDLDKGLNILESQDGLSLKAKGSARIAKTDSILVTCIGATIGKTGLIKKVGAFNQQINSIEPNRFTIPKFLYFQAISNKFQNQIKEKASSTTLPILNKSKFSSLFISFPPLPEQRAIVAKIEQLFSELDNGVSSLRKAQDQLKVYRQAVLKKAFEGDWTTMKIEDVCQVKVGIVIKPTQFYSEGVDGIPAFRSQNVREFRINNSNWVYFTELGNEQNKRTQLKVGDVLIVRSGYPGTSCVVTEEYEGSNAIDILIARPDLQLITSKYLCCFNNSPLGKGLFVEGSRGVAQKHLNVGIYNGLSIPIPTLEEQNRIVQEIESRLSICDKLEADIQQNLDKAEVLRQSILKKAFEGDLLTEEELATCKREPDWEPVERLLERVKNV